MNKDELKRINETLEAYNYHPLDLSVLNNIKSDVEGDWDDVKHWWDHSWVKKHIWGVATGVVVSGALILTCALDKNSAGTSECVTAVSKLASEGKNICYKVFKKIPEAFHDMKSWGIKHIYYKVPVKINGKEVIKEEIDWPWDWKTSHEVWKALPKSTQQQCIKTATNVANGMISGAGEVAQDAINKAVNHIVFNHNEVIQQLNNSYGNSHNNLINNIIQFHGATVGLLETLGHSIWKALPYTQTIDKYWNAVKGEWEDVKNGHGILNDLYRSMVEIAFLFNKFGHNGLDNLGTWVNEITSKTTSLSGLINKAKGLFDGLSGGGGR